VKAKLQSRGSKNPALNNVSRRSKAVRNILAAGVQPKLKIGAVNDPAELEADRVADQVMRMPDKAASSEIESTKPVGDILRRKCADCDDETIQRKEIPEIRMKGDAGSSGGGTASPETSRAINSLGAGTPFPVSERRFFEPRFGRDLSNIRLHTGGTADAASKAINARAFSLGNSIAFANGEYSPGTHSGRTLMAHEITHALQGVGIRRKPTNLTGKQEIYKTHLEIFSHLFLARAESWKNTVRDYGSAFAIAKEKHEKTIEAQDRRDALKEAVMWGAVTAISGAAFSWASSVAQTSLALKKGVKIFEALEDGVQAGLGEIVDVIQSQTSPNTPSAGEIPLVYQNNLEKPISNAIIQHHKAMASRKKSLVNGLQITNKDIKNLMDATEKWEKLPQPFVEHDKIPDVGIIAIELEKRIWARWAKNGTLKARVKKTVRTGDKFDTLYPIEYETTEWYDPGYILEKRFTALGITKAAKISDYGTHFFFGTWTSDETIEKLYDYLKNYKGIPITKLKK